MLLNFLALLCRDASIESRIIATNPGIRIATLAVSQPSSNTNFINQTKKWLRVFVVTISQNDQLHYVTVSGDWGTKITGIWLICSESKLRQSPPGDRVKCDGSCAAPPPSPGTSIKAGSISPGLFISSSEIIKTEKTDDGSGDACNSVRDFYDALELPRRWHNRLYEVMALWDRPIVCRKNYC